MGVLVLIIHLPRLSLTAARFSALCPSWDFTCNNRMERSGVSEYQHTFGSVTASDQMM